MTQAQLDATIAELTAKRDAAQAKIDAAQKVMHEQQSIIDAAQAELDGYAKQLIDLANMKPTDETMAPYFADASGGKLTIPFGDITIDRMPPAVGVDGAAGTVSLRVSRPGWVSPAVKIDKAPYFITNNWKPNEYKLLVTIGTKTTPYKWTISATPTTPNTVPTPTQPPPVVTPTGLDPRKDYPVAFPYSPLPQDAEGWTIFNASIDSKVIYVSPSGSDADTGTLSKPVKTLVKAMSMVRTGFPDQILLQCGGDYGKIGQWKASGRSASEPMVLSSYGTGERPIVRELVTGETQKINNVAFVGLWFYAKERDYTRAGFNLANVRDDLYGISWAALGTGIHFEDCRVSHFWYNVYLHGPQAVVRRCVIDHAWCAKGDKSQGMYISGGGILKENGPSLTLEENVIHHNGWAEFKDGKPPKGNQTGPWMFSHGVYTAEHCGPILYRRNIVTRNANNGINGRSGGVLEDNLAADNSSAMYVGRMASKANENKPCWIRQNVCVSAEHGNGFGLETPFWYAGKVEDNIVANRGANASNGFAIRIDPARTEKYIPSDPSAHTPSTSTIDHNRNVYWNAGMIKILATSGMVVRGTGNVCNAPEGVVYESGSPKQANLQVAKTATFKDPSRDIESYMKTIGEDDTSVEAFGAEACRQRKGQWSKSMMASVVNDYVRAGFN